MKSFLRLSLVAIAVAFLFCSLSVIETKAQFNQQEILNRMDKHNKALQSLRASVTMVKYNDQLKESDTIEGSTVYLPSKGRDAYVRIDWTKPVSESLWVANGKYALYRPRLKQAIIGKVKDAQGSPKTSSALAFMSMSKAQLKANYTFKYIGSETVSSGAETAHLELTPKTASSYKSAEIWVDSDGMPVQAKIIEKNKDSTTVLLYNLKKNVTVDAKEFVPDYPKDTKKIPG